MSAQGSNASMQPTLDSDIVAFKHKHPLDSKRQRLVGELALGQFLIESRTVFEIFAFSAPGIECTFDIRGIKTALATGKLTFKMYELELDVDFIEHVRKNNGVEVGRMAELTAADLARPGICLMWPDGHSTVVDGNNRLVRRWDDGLKTFRFAMVAVDRKLLPFMCDPGKEEQFIERDHEPGMTTLAIQRISR